MNVMNNSSDEQVECPLCMEPLEVDDLNFYPCTCGYQICRFCWHRIRTDENELCPACRKAYPENPADFTPLSQEQIAAFKAEKRQRDQQRKAKISENRKHLANVRVVQKNLVFVVGLPPRLAEAEILKKHEYFGKYGKIHKVVINPSTTYAGVQGPSASAYVTYVNNNDALRAIQSVNNIMIDNRLIKTSLGTTKYCSHFMKNQTCPKPDCMYLHELGDSEASFTKEEMHQGKHQEYEKRLHDTMLAAQASQPVVQTNGISTGQTIGTTTLVTTTNGIITNGTGGGKTGDTKQISDITNGPIQNKDAWPSLSTSPVNTKENKLNGKTGTNNKENINRNDRKHDKTKMDKSKGGTKVSNGSQKTTNGTHNTNTESHKSKHIKQIHHHITDVDDDDDDDDEEEEEEDDDEIDEFEELDNDALSSDNEIKADTPSLSSNNGDSGTVSGKSSPGAFPDPPQISSPSTHEIHTGSQNGHVIANSSMAAVTNNTNNSTNIGNNSNKTEMSINNLEKLTNSVTNLNSGISSSGSSGIGTSESTQSSSSSLFSNAPASQSETTKLPGNLNGVKINANNLTDASSRFSKLSLFDDNNSFFSHNAFQSFYGGLNGTLEHGHTTNSHLPDLLNGTTDSQEHSAKELLKNLGLGISDTNSMPLNTTDDWEAAFKYMMRNNKTVDDHEEYMRMQELQKRNNFINSGLNLPQFNNGFNGDVNLDYFHNSNDLSSRLSHQSQNQQQRLNSLHSNGMGHVYPENMSKFFDFHKNQQQQQQQSQQNQFILNGHSSNIVPPSPADPMNIASLLENSRFNTNFIDQQHTNGLLGSQMQKQRLLNNQMNTHNLLLNNNQQQQPQQNNRLLNSQFTQNQNIDDDLGNILGFDPFFETQKGLAELLNDEILQHQQQQQQTSKILENVQRTRMPPPGFNHMNAFGFGVPRAQGSKILPFMNLGNNTQQQQQQPPQTNWGQQQQQQQQHMGYPQNEQSHAQQQNNLNKSGFGNNFNTFTDWTSFDPAIVSFRQFPSFINGQSVNGPNQPNGNDIFMSQQLNQQNLPQQQQQQQQPGQGFGHHGINLQSSIMNQQQSNQQAQVNFSHSNWLNTDQNIYMNNLSNGFTNNFEKFTIPMPPGFQSNVTGTSKQKAECIN